MIYHLDFVPHRSLKIRKSNRNLSQYLLSKILTRSYASLKPEPTVFFNRLYYCTLLTLCHIVSFIYEIGEFQKTSENLPFCEVGISFIVIPFLTKSSLAMISVFSLSSEPLAVKFSGLSDTFSTSLSIHGRKFFNSS